jgi:hypothetical protein
MTTIVADLYGMGSDKRVSGGTMFTAEKIQRIKGSLYGGCGNFEQVLKMFEWFKNPDMKPEWKFEPDFEILQLSPEGLFFWGSEMIAIPIMLPYFAIGSGGHYALGAMECGADLTHAIKVASKYDSSTGHGISLIKLRMADPEPVKAKRTKRGK